LCQALEIEHRLTQPRTPQTNGMVERFNGRIADILRTHRFVSGQDLEETLHRYVSLYNHQLPQTALGSKPPIQAMKDWFKSHPELFHRQPYDRPGCDTYAHPCPPECWDVQSIPRRPNPISSAVHFDIGGTPLNTASTPVLERLSGGSADLPMKYPG
jgi:hypothetical protein